MSSALRKTFLRELLRAFGADNLIIVAPLLPVKLLRFFPRLFGGLKLERSAFFVAALAGEIIPAFFERDSMRSDIRVCSWRRGGKHCCRVRRVNYCGIFRVYSGVFIPLNNRYVSKYYVLVICHSIAFIERQTVAVACSKNDFTENMKRTGKNRPWVGMTRIPQ